MRKHRVNFLSPGTFTAEQSSREVETWDIGQAVEIAKDIIERYNAKPYGFIFETYLWHPPVPDGEGGFLQVHTKHVEKSGTHFLTGKLDLYDDVVERNSSTEDILRSNMFNNGYWVVCVNDNSWRSTMPFDEKDVIVNWDGVITERGNDPIYVKYRTAMAEKRKAYYAKAEEERQAAREKAK